MRMATAFFFLKLVSNSVNLCKDQMGGCFLFQHLQIEREILRKCSITKEIARDESQASFSCQL
jgi:hypothetical protein